MGGINGIPGDIIGLGWAELRKSWNLSCWLWRLELGFWIPMQKWRTTVRKKAEIHSGFLKEDCVPHIIGIGIGMEGIGIMEGMGIVGIIGLGLWWSSLATISVLPLGMVGTVGHLSAWRPQHLGVCRAVVVRIFCHSWFQGLFLFRIKIVFETDRGTTKNTQRSLFEPCDPSHCTFTCRPSVYLWWWHHGFVLDNTCHSTVYLKFWRWGVVTMN